MQPECEAITGRLTKPTAAGPSGLRLVLLDPHLLFAEAFCRLLEAKGHDVLACLTTLGEAHTFFSQAHADSARPDVVVMEVELPEAQGADAIARMKHVASNIPVAVLTGSTDLARLKSVVAAGADGLATKTESVEEVQRLLRSVRSSSECVLSRRATSLLRGGARKAPGHQPTAREITVIKLLADGATTEEIARTLQVRPTTVRTHLRHLFVKMNVHSRLQLIALAVREGLLEETAA